jgi:hypothetical protein
MFKWFTKSSKSLEDSEDKMDKILEDSEDKRDDNALDRTISAYILYHYCPVKVTNDHANSLF